jgi:hypothetical protein
MKFPRLLKPLFALLLGASTVAPHVFAAKIEHGVPTANPRVGTTPNRVADDFSLVRIAEGSEPLENPSGVITNFGLLSNGTPTEPDENTYIVFDHNPGGPDANFDYGRHFLYQGHENGGGLAYVTRINLDVTSAQHRITLLTPVDATGKTGFSSIDGSVYNPFTRTFLFTQEAGASGGVIQITSGWPPVVTTLDGILGKGGFEGVHIDDRGNIYLVEDTGGVSVNVNPADPNSPKKAKQPNSFVYRFMPNDITDISKGGKLQALQVTINGTPLVFTNNASADVFSTAQLQLHTPGSSYPVSWITIHDTAISTVPFDANAAAKTAGATPFKRPENIAFLPGSGFNTFFFDPTGDTDTLSGEVPALQARGAYGSIFRVDFYGNSNQGEISLFYLGDHTHNSFDNLTFADNQTLLAAEDRGDGLHEELNTLDSIWAFDVRHHSSPKRLIAEGRDPIATANAAAGEGDNEPTGLIVSNGSSSIHHLLYKSVSPHARWFFTQQHGMNQIFEIVRQRDDDDHGEGHGHRD